MNRTPPERIMGLDVGGKRTGVAVSDDLGVIATPVGYVLRGDRDRDEFRALVARFGITKIVAGLPSNMSGTEGLQAERARDYADALAGDLDLPLDYWDERLTSTIAERRMVEAGVRRDRRKERIDAIAAAIMLQDYLDSEANYRKRRNR
jgi:putative holliday junction resolvase